LSSPWDIPPDTEDEHGGSRQGCLWSGLAGLLVVGLVVTLIMLRGDAVPGDTEWGRLVYLVMLLTFVGAGLGGAFARNPGKSLRHMGIWIAIAGSLALLYSFESEFTKLYETLAAKADPATARNRGDAVVLQAGQNGHFYVRATVRGETILFMVDTGASDVVLSHAAAEALGHDLDRLQYSRMYSTANGIVTGAPVTLSYVAIGSIEVRGVSASVNKTDLDTSLLGLSFLSRLSGYEVKGDQLILYP
jgi:aspartyl protease family protein